MARKNRGPQLTKEEKLLGVDTCREMEAMEVSALEELIVQSNASIKEAKDQLEANDKYQEVRAQVKALTGGFNDLKKRQSGKIAFALKLREAKGK